MTGDVEKQPVEGADTLSDLAEQMVDGEEEASELPGESEEGDKSEAAETEDEAESEEETEEEQEEDHTVTIKHDGKEVEVKLSEALNLAQQGFDYTKKTQVLADERKAVEATKAQAEDYRKQNEAALTETLNRLQAFAEFAEKQVGDPPPIEWAQQDAAYYIAKKQEHEDRKGQLQHAKAAIEALQQEQHRQRQAQLSQKADETEKALRDTLPGWNDNTLQELAEYLGKVGLTPENLDAGFVEQGLWLLAHKAKAYDAIQADKAKLKPKAQLQKVQKPTATNQPNRSQVRHQEAMKAFRSKPSTESLAELIG